MTQIPIRNIAIIAHVDHGKTTLVDKLLQQSGAMGDRAKPTARVLDSGELEKERGITILSKVTAIDWQGIRVNIVDTPGHADFGGEVERVLSMVDSVLLLVDAVEGPMPQTRFVTEKALQRGFAPIVVINKIDRDGARVDWVHQETFDLFDKLGATDEQLDFMVVYASALNGIAGMENPPKQQNMNELLDVMVNNTPMPKVQSDGPLQMQFNVLDYSPYVGGIGIGRIIRGTAKRNMAVTVIDAEGKKRSERILQILRSTGLERKEVASASAGDIVAISGIEKIRVSDTVCDPECVEALPEITVEQPTVGMEMLVNNSPFAGKDGKFLTSRQLKERLQRELIHNVALQVVETEDSDRIQLYGRGELHLAILLESMRREGYEMSVSRPQVVFKQDDEGKWMEPFEDLVTDIDSAHQGVIMEMMGAKRGQLKDMQTDSNDRVRLQYVIPTRDLIGLRTTFLSATSGTGLMHHNFSHYGHMKGENTAKRSQGALIANGNGKALGYALFNLQKRGRLFVGPGEEIYEGMIVGIHSNASDLVVNPMKAKQLTNIRAAGTDENILLTPPLKFPLEQAIEFVDDDELVEITPKNIRIRKRYLKEADRRRLSRQKSA